ncbi:MAG TPA: serine/threonine-protein kinase [Pantanalinema sp.]
MDFSNVPRSPASEAPPEVVNAFLKFVQQNPSMFMGKQVELNDLKQAPQHMYFRCAGCDAPVLSGMEECPSCRRSTNQTLKAGDVLQQRYRIEERMMKTGGFGNLYTVTDIKEKRPLAMKQLQHRRQVSDKDRLLFEREGRLLKSFKHHSIPYFYEAFTIEGAMYLVMERIQGVTLGQYMRLHGAFSEEQVLTLLPQMLEVLSYLHHLRVPVIHRDVKPGNFMFTEDAHVYLIDFGAATDIQPRTDALGPSGLPEELTGVFTKGFTPPELFLGMSPMPASDLFALGATVLFLLTARHPFTQFEPMSGTYRLDELGVSAGLRPILAKLLALGVADRYQDAEHVLEDLMSAGYIVPNA